MKSVMRLVATTAIGVLATLGGAQAQDKLVLRSADTHVDGYPTVEAVKFMSEQLSKATNGRLSIQVFPASQLGEEKDTVQQTQFGVLDMNRISSAVLNNIVPETNVLGLPFVFKSIEQMHHVVDGPIGDEILAACESHGMIGLAYYDSGARSMYNKLRPIKSPDDMKGMKIRVQQSDLFIDTMKALGAAPTPMPFGEVYSGLQTGVVDGAENNWPSYETTRHFEVAKYFSLTEHSMMPEILVMSKKTWDKLTPADQAAVRKAAKDSVPFMRKMWAEQEKTAQEHVTAAGSQVNEVNKDAFIKAVQPVYEKYVKDDKMKDLVARIQATN